MLTPSEVSEIRAVAPLARLARAQHSPDSAHAKASARLSHLLVTALPHSSVRELADAAQISYHSTARRIRLATESRIRDIPKTGEENLQSHEETPAAEEGTSEA